LFDFTRLAGLIGGDARGVDIIGMNFMPIFGQHRRVGQAHKPGSNHHDFHSSGLLEEASTDFTDFPRAYPCRLQFAFSID
jgi:hypothetical protein